MDGNSKNRSRAHHIEDKMTAKTKAKRLPFKNEWGAPLAGVDSCEHQILLQVNYPRPTLGTNGGREYYIRAYCSRCRMSGEWVLHKKKGERPSKADERKAISNFYKAALHFEVESDEDPEVIEEEETEEEETEEVEILAINPPRNKADAKKEADAKKKRKK